MSEQQKMLPDWHDCRSGCELKLDSELARLRSEVEAMRQTLQHVAAVAHAGGLCDLSHIDALIVVRHLTGKSFNRSTKAEQVRAAIDAAMGVKS